MPVNTLTMTASLSIELSKLSAAAIEGLPSRSAEEKRDAALVKSFMIHKRNFVFYRK